MTEKEPPIKMGGSLLVVDNVSQTVKSEMKSKDQ